MEGLLELNLVSTGFKAFAMLLIVLAVLMLVLFLLKRFSILRRESKGELPIKVLSSMPLSAKDRIEVVEISGEKIVLGVSPGGIKFLTKIKGLSDEQ